MPDLLVEPKAAASPQALYLTLLPEPWDRTVRDLFYLMSLLSPPSTLAKWSVLYFHPLLFSHPVLIPQPFINFLYLYCFSCLSKFTQEGVGLHCLSDHHVQQLRSPANLEALPWGKPHGALWSAPAKKPGLGPPSLVVRIQPLGHILPPPQAGPPIDPPSLCPGTPPTHL